MPSGNPRTLRALLAGAAALLLVLCGCERPAVDSQFVDAILRADSTIQAAIDERLVPGAVVLVARDGDVVFERAYGHARLRDFEGNRLADPEPMTTEHLFDLASVTKVLATTFAVMLLVDRGDLDLDALVSRYLPEFKGPSKDSVTVRHLLSHSGGLAQWKPIYYHATNARGARTFVTSESLAFPVGEERRYSDLGFMLLGYIVEEISGQNLQDFLRAELYLPLGLQSTGFRPLDLGIGPFAATSHGNPFERRMVADDEFGYLCEEDPDSFTGWRNYTLVGEVNDGNAFHAHAGVAGHAGLFSTAADVNVLLDLLLSYGTSGRRELLGADVVKEFLAPDAAGNGLGWIMSNGLLGVDGLPPGSFGHTGFTGTYVLGVPTFGLSVVLLTNRQNLGVDSDTRYNDVNPLRRAVAGAILAGFGPDEEP